MGLPRHDVREIYVRGDSIGTGYVGVGQISVEQFVGPSSISWTDGEQDNARLFGGHTGELRAQR